MMSRQRTELTKATVCDGEAGYKMGRPPKKSQVFQWSFLVPLIGGYVAYHPIGKEYKWYISGLYCQLGDYIYHLPPIKGTRNSYWFFRVY